MAKEFAKDFYNSPAWKKTRKLYKQFKFGICERCQQPNGYMVHHKIYLNAANINNYSISLNFKNLELLCKLCHNKEHFEKYSAVPQGVGFNEHGEVIQLN